MTSDERILALSWNIATEPKLYWQLAPNPYSPQATQIISTRFPDVGTADIIKAVILAEPEGQYDRNFRLLNSEQQTAQLSNQQAAEVEMNKRLAQYCHEFAAEFSQLSPEFVYNSLSSVVFGSTDPQEIAQKYAQNQRRDFRLTIISFIEKTHSPEALDKKPISVPPLAKIAFAALSLVLLFYLQPQNTPQYPDAGQQTLGIEAQQNGRALPVRLKIPTLNVDAAIENVGVTPQGAMEVPKNTVDVGWFDLGPRPGEKGSAVIAGHFNGENGSAGVFNNLSGLKEGDKLYIEDEHGVTIEFVVRNSQSYDLRNTADVFSRNDSAHLNLITCDGVWDASKNTYSKRLVVFADLEN